MVALVDTNVLVYRVDPQDRRKQKIATELLENGLDGSVRIAHQAIVEFYVAVTRPRRGGAPPLLSVAAATRETEDLLLLFDILYPTEEVVRAALLATAAYQLSWFDAQMWAYATTNGLPELISEDFQHDRRYGTVRVVNPFVV